MRTAIMGLVLAVMALAGCGGAREGSKAVPGAAQANPMGQAAGAGQQGPVPATVERQIVYRAQVYMVVERVDAFGNQVLELAKTHGGFLSNSETMRYSGSALRGRWVVRVPAKGYEAFVEDVRKLGEVTQLTMDSEDVSAEYYDVEARIRNRQKEEMLLLKLLEERTGKLEDVLAVEKELSRVREEIERMQGRMTVLKDLVSLSTVTIHVSEVAGVLPTQSASLTMRISRAWNGSLVAMRTLGEAAVIAAAASAPWIALVGLPIALLIGVRRRNRRVTTSRV